MFAIDVAHRHAKKVTCGTDAKDDVPVIRGSPPPAPRGADAMPLSIATWNVNSLRVRLPQLTEWLATANVDVVALQETKLPDTDFPQAAIEALGYQVAYAGQRTYNGVAVLSRQPVVADAQSIPGFPDEQRRVLAVETAGLRVIDLYVPNGQALDSDKYDYKLRWLAALRTWLAGEAQKHPNLVVLGDFNIAPEDRDVHDPKAWEGGVHVSPAERASLRELLELGFVDVFRRFEQPEKSYSWWDYRAAAFRRNHGLRIDLILASAAFAQRCTACTIDREPRRAERPSDHTPVIATFDI
jgi:exodeoxyribonuclease III